MEKTLDEMRIASLMKAGGRQAIKVLFRNKKRGRGSNDRTGRIRKVRWLLEG